MGFKFWHRGKVWFWVTVMAIVLTSCSLRSAAARVPQLIFASPSDPTTFNVPLNDSLFSRFVYQYLYEGLVGTNGVTQELQPALAESWKISDDNLRLEFTLREGLKWSDGAPLTTDDVMFSFQEVYLNPKIATDIKDILRVGESGAFPTIRQLDSRRVEFVVPEPFAPFLRRSSKTTKAISNSSPPGAPTPTRAKSLPMVPTSWRATPPGNASSSGATPTTGAKIPPASPSPM
jgi:ABC-type transport system substrate-binding protein